MINYPSSTDLSAFSKSKEHREVKYGLPSEVCFCSVCVESNQRPSTTVEYQNVPGSKKEAIDFDDKSVCSACLFTERKEITDWEERERELIEVCNKYRRHDGSFDCLVPGSGGKDSIYVAHLLKHKYGMNPLTVTWAPNLVTDWGRKNFDAWIASGQDNILVTPNVRTHRLLTRLAVDNLFHPFQPFIFGQKSLAPRIAAQFGIQLIFYGEHEAEYGSPIKSNDFSIQDNKFFSKDDTSKLFFGGTEYAALIEDFGIKPSEMAFYIPVDKNEIEDRGIVSHYFGYYVKWHPQSAYYFAREVANFEPSPERTAGTYSKYSSIDDKMDDFHYYTTGIKFGRGRATEDAAQEIRSGDITREEGVALVHRYDLEWPQRFAEEIFRYLSIPEREYPIASSMFEEPTMDRHYFDDLCNAFRSPHLWHFTDGEWQLRYVVS